MNPKGSSAFLTHGLAEKTIRLATPTIEALFAESDPNKDPEAGYTGLLKRPTIAIVIADGTNRPRTEEDGIRTLGTFVLGSTRDDTRFMGIARSKADISWKYQRDSRDVINVAPQLLQEGDTIYEGGRYRNGIVVAASGVQAHFDAMIADIVMAIIEGLIREQMASLRDSGVDYIAL